MKTKTFFLAILWCMLCSKLLAQNIIKLEIASIDKPNDVYKYNLAAATVDINKPQELEGDSVASTYDEDEVLISISFKTMPDNFIYQLIASYKNKCKGKIICSSEEGNKNLIVYDFDLARILRLSSQHHAGDQYGSTMPSIEVSARKVKVNGIEIEINKSK